MSQALTCREFVDFLDDYLSGALPEDKRAAFNEHLAVCPSCVAYMKTYQASVRLGKAVLTRSEEALPEEVPEELVLAILAARKKP
jgi:anti-sigma factor RsiW